MLDAKSEIHPELLRAISRLRGQQAAVCNIIAAQPGITTGQIADQLYADREDGGPETGNAVVVTVLSAAKKKMRAAGWEIVGRGKNGKRFMPVVAVSPPTPEQERDENTLSGRVWKMRDAGHCAAVIASTLGISRDAVIRVLGFDPADPGWRP